LILERFRVVVKKAAPTGIINIIWMRLFVKRVINDNNSRKSLPIK